MLNGVALQCNTTSVCQSVQRQSVELMMMLMVMVAVVVMMKIMARMLLH